MERDTRFALGNTRQRRTSERRAMALEGRLLWKDDTGAMRFIPVVTRNISDHGVFVECETAASIPLFRLVHLQVDRSTAGDGVPDSLRQGRVLSAVYRLGRFRPSTGTPEGYALRLLLEPRSVAVAQGEASSRSIA